MRSLKKLGGFFAGHPLTRNAPSKAWLRFVSWQIRSRLQEEVVVEWIEGQRLAVRRGMTGATGNVYVGLHEFVDMSFLLHFLRDEDLFVDVGANIGSFTILAAGVCEASSWSFEPDPETVRHLRRNIHLNNIGDRVNICESALGDYSGESAFTVGLDSVNRILKSSSKKSRTIRINRLDDIIGSSRPTMFKIDVEGHEEHVLRGARNALDMPSLKAVQIETLSPAAVSALESRGFERAYYHPFERKISKSPNGMTSSNALYLRDWKSVEQRVVSAKKIRVLDASV